ncbi:hypothetical protein yberc0001_12750 [Yersinia bercovieri ATCC 43970]|uniref:Uncharacterized protein n=1 Tax=Yersinia bercovieri ATCC 43970 TaxID=349968 RepID=A0ABM9XV48_YERBE|nr:hypothetical protein yberc0001_12750 [Yersinia bercovieri ATCC 43970]
MDDLQGDQIIFLVSLFMARQHFNLPTKASFLLAFKNELFAKTLLL